MRMFLFIFFGTLSLCSCQSKPKDSSKIPLAPLTGYPITIGATPFLAGATNSHAVFSLNGSKIYFVSSNRRDHRNSQVYEYDLSTRTDRRITFQDGEILSVTSAPTGNIFYASNTDEIKEEPFAREQDYRFSRSEMYHSDLFGEQIDRLTNSPGFDGEMVYVPAREQLLFTSLRSGNAGLYWLAPAEKEPIPFQVNKNQNRAATLSGDGKFIYWVEEEPGTKSQNLVRSTVLGKNRTVVRSVLGVVKSMAVNASGKIAYAWQPEKADFTQIDLFTPDSNCNRSLLKSKMDFSEPQFWGKNENVLLFRGSVKENSVVYRWELPEALGPCLQ